MNTIKSPTANFCFKGFKESCNPARKESSSLGVIPRRSALNCSKVVGLDSDGGDIFLGVSPEEADLSDILDVRFVVPYPTVRPDTLLGPLLDLVDDPLVVEPIGV